MTISKDVTRIVLAGMGIASLASLVYLAGPLIAIGGFRPFESYIVREITIALIVAAAASFGGFKFYRRKKNAAALAAGVSEAEKKESDEVVLKDKMKDALATLRSASGGKKDYLYDLPWYLLIGPPGSDRIDQFRPQIPAVARRRPGGHRRRRRHSLLRLVVHRRGSSYRYRRSLHDPGFRYRVR